jgi:MSHA pilin protein MshA
MKSKASGFTLIELVVVIVILGILAAVAAPKFVNLSSDSRTAVMKGVEGAMRSANSMIYAKAAVAGKEAAASDTVTVNGASVATVYGFGGTAAAVASVMDLDSNLVAAATCGAGSDEQCIYHAGASAGQTTCYIKYTAATGTSTPPVYTGGVLSGC